MKVQSWVVRKPGDPMVCEERSETPGSGQVLVRVAGCGVCHTDLGYYYDGVPTRHPFPLTLGHELSGTVVDAAPQGRQPVHRLGPGPARLAGVPAGGARQFP